MSALVAASSQSAAIEPLSLISTHHEVFCSQEPFKFQAGAQVLVFSAKALAVVASTFSFSRDSRLPRLRPLWPVQIKLKLASHSFITGCDDVFPPFQDLQGQEELTIPKTFAVVVIIASLTIILTL